MKSSKLMRLATVLAIVVATTGCAALKPALLCNQTEYEAIQRENARLVERRKVIQGYVNGDPINREQGSMTTREHLIQVYVTGYNTSLELLQIRSAEFNSLCAGKPSFWANKD